MFCVPLCYKQIQLVLFKKYFPTITLVTKPTSRTLLNLMKNTTLPRRGWGGRVTWHPVCKLNSLPGPYLLRLAAALPPVRAGELPPPFHWFPSRVHSWLPVASLVQRTEGSLSPLKDGVCAQLLRFKNYSILHVVNLDGDRKCHILEVGLPCQYQLHSTKSIVNLVPNQFVHIECFVKKRKEMFRFVHVTSHITLVIIPALSCTLEISKSG